MKKFLIKTMGCKSNQFEGSLMRERLIEAGFEEADKINSADIFILNSCTVTHKSDNEAFYILRNAKRENPNVFSILTGCIAQVEKAKLLEHDFIDCVIGNDEKLDIVKYISDGQSHVSDIMNLDKFHNAYLAGTLKTRASLKIQDGCDNRCSYCIIPFARGKNRSADEQFIIEQINQFEKEGFKEAVFTGIHIGQWGKDFGKSLIHLLKVIETETDIERYRLGSLNPLEIDDEMLDFLSVSKKFCPHFHLSLQSACNKTLKSMNRFYNVEDYLNLIEKITQKFDLPFLGSDIIAGFAGETDEDFAQTVENLKKSKLTQIHTFPYSVRKGTAAETFEGHLSDSIKQECADIIKAVSKQKNSDFINANVNTVREVLVEKHPDKKTGLLKGVTRNYLNVLFEGDESLLGTLQAVNITEYKDGKLYGELHQAMSL